MRLGGPQSERDELWNSRLESNRVDLVPPSKILGGGDSQVFESEIYRLRNENKSLRDQLQRSLRELKSYQLQFPSANPKNHSNIEQNDEESDWIASFEVINPLLEAYDTRTRQLEDNLKIQEVKLESCKQHIELLINENEELRQSHLTRLQQTGNQPMDLLNQSDRELPPSLPLNNELFAELNERIAVLMDENSLLLEQKLLLSTELDKNQQEKSDQAQELNKLIQKISQVTKDIQSLTEKKIQAEKDREEAAKQALLCSEALGKSEIELDICNEQLGILKQQNYELESQVQDLRKQLKEFHEKNDVDNILTIRRVKLVDDRNRELQALLSQRNQELETAVEVNRKLRIEYQNTRQDAEGMLQVMGGLERQLNDYSAREEKVEKMSRLNKEKIEEVLSIKEQSELKEQQYRNQIDRLLEERKTLALQRTDEMDRYTDQAKAAMEEQLRAFEKEMEELSARNGRLIAEAEKANRDNKFTQDSASRLERIHADAMQSIQSSILNLSEKLNSLSVAKEQEYSKRVDIQEQNSELRSNIDKLRTQLESLKTSHLQQERNHDVQLSELKNSLRDAMKDLSEKQRLLNRKTKEIEDLRAKAEGQLTTAERRFTDETALYKRRAAEADWLSRDLEAAGIALDIRTQTLIDQLKEKYVSAVAQMESKLRNESDLSKTISSKLRHSETVIRDLMDEKEQTSRLIDELKSNMKELEEENGICKTTINELTRQLSVSYSAREDGAVRAAMAIEGLNQNKFDINNNSSMITSPFIENFQLEDPLSHENSDVYV